MNLKKLKSSHERRRRRNPRDAANERRGYERKALRDLRKEDEERARKRESWERRVGRGIGDANKRQRRGEKTLEECRG